MTVDLELDFGARQVRGGVVLRMERVGKGDGKVVLDTRLVLFSFFFCLFCFWCFVLFFRV